MSQTSAGLTVRMLPKRMAKRSALKPRARLIRTTATAKPPDRNTASAASPWSAPRARIRSMPTAPASVTTRAPRIGDTPRKRPRATPASATWASVSAISDSRRGTRKTPMAGQMSAVIAPTANARCMNPYWRNSGMARLSAGGRPRGRRAVERRERGIAQEVARPAVEDEAPVEARELGDLLGDDADVVAHEDERDLALAVQMLEQGVEARLGLGIDAARGLVQDQELGVRDQRARDEDALLLPGRQRADAGAGMRGHADLAEHLGDARALGRARPGRRGRARHEAGRHDLLDGGGQARVEDRLLRHVAEAAPLRGTADGDMAEEAHAARARAAGAPA